MFKIYLFYWHLCLLAFHVVQPLSSQEIDTGSHITEKQVVKNIFGAFFKTNLSHADRILCIKNTFFELKLCAIHCKTIYLQRVNQFPCLPGLSLAKRANRSSPPCRICHPAPPAIRMCHPTASSIFSRDRHTFVRSQGLSLHLFQTLGAGRLGGDGLRMPIRGKPNGKSGTGERHGDAPSENVRNSAPRAPEAPTRAASGKPQREARRPAASDTPGIH